jgi:hypothetical protein
MMVDQEQERHEMSHVKTYESGVDEWYCSICGRRFLLEWPPEYKKIILQPGNESAIHSGGKGGLKIGVPQVIQAEDGDQFDDSLNPFRDFLDNNDFDLP